MATIEMALVFIYLFIGVVYVVCSKRTKVSADKETEKPMLMLYMLFIVYFWPVFVVLDIFKK